MKSLFFRKIVNENHCIISSSVVNNSNLDYNLKKHISPLFAVSFTLRWKKLHPKEFKDTAQVAPVSQKTSAVISQKQLVPHSSFAPHPQFCSRPVPAPAGVNAAAGSVILIPRKKHMYAECARSTVTRTASATMRGYFTAGYPTAAVFITQVRTELSARVRR